MSDTILALLSGLAIVISAISGLYVARTTAKSKNVENDDLLSKINTRIQKQVEDAYDKLISMKDLQVAEKEERIKDLEKDADIKDKRIAKLEQDAIESAHRIDELEINSGLMEESYKKQAYLYKQYINYLLNGIEYDKKGTFKPFDLDHFNTDGTANFMGK